MSQIRQSRGHGAATRREPARKRGAAAGGSRAPIESDAPLVWSGDESRAVSGIAADFKDGERLARHRHRRAQLVYAVEGVMTVKTETGLWVVPPLRAVWLPPGVAHSIRMTGRVRMRTVYFDPDILERAATPVRCCVLTVSPLMRELIVRIVEHDDSGRTAVTPQDGGKAAPRASGRHERLVAALLDELVESPVACLEIPMPSDARLRRIAEAVTREPADPRDIPAWARFAGVGERTLARLFPEQTGMTFVRWRQQVRLLRALERLALGESVTTVAMDLGYGSISAFVRLFRESLGVTPGRYFER